MGPVIVYVAPISQTKPARSTNTPTRSHAVRPRSRSQRGATNTVDPSSSWAAPTVLVSWCASAGRIGGRIRCQNFRFTFPVPVLPSLDRKVVGRSVATDCPAPPCLDGGRLVPTQALAYPLVLLLGDRAVVAEVAQLLELVDHLL